MLGVVVVWLAFSAKQKANRTINAALEPGSG
jgi:hypothetical protein